MCETETEQDRRRKREEKKIDISHDCRETIWLLNARRNSSLPSKIEKEKMVRATHTTKCYKTLFHDPVKQKPRHVMKTYSQQKQKREKEERVKLWLGSRSNITLPINFSGWRETPIGGWIYFFLSSKHCFEKFASTHVLRAARMWWDRSHSTTHKPFTLANTHFFFFLFHFFCLFLFFFVFLGK